ncbi:protein CHLORORESPIRATORY REDUCTION 42, chloroplastic [Bidens hawaiensis]|uniref:protein CHLORORESPIRATORY REDUCTION 42, chloroplastic n=1 Tax=Bidens hawaiensis TaxID=980011 RepID=UPI00404A5DFB
MASAASSLHVSVTVTLSSYSNGKQLFPLRHISSTIGFSDKKKWQGIRNNQSCVGRIMCESKESSNVSDSLQIGSPIIIVEAPKMLKTAASVPCLRVNSGLVKAGDVGRIMSRKPKDVWAVRLTIGTYLIDGKYFKPLQLDADNN